MFLCLIHIWRGSLEDEVDKGVDVVDVHCAIGVEVGQRLCIGVVVGSQDDADADVQIVDIHLAVVVQVAEQRDGGHIQVGEGEAEAGVVVFEG